jgi:hypothetical protein
MMCRFGTRYEFMLTVCDTHLCEKKKKKKDKYIISIITQIALLVSSFIYHRRTLRQLIKSTCEFNQSLIVNVYNI